MYKIKDKRYFKWGSSRGGNASYGCYMKSSEEIKGIKYYYKLSNYNSSQGFYGDEAVYEVIASRLLRKLGFNAVKYNLEKIIVTIHGIDYTTYSCISKDFSIGYNSRITFEKFRETMMNIPVEQIIAKFNFSDAIKQIIIVDFIINR